MYSSLSESFFGMMATVKALERKTVGGKMNLPLSFIILTAKHTDTDKLVSVLCVLREPEQVKA
jgi:hypothetical protein